MRKIRYTTAKTSSRYTRASRYELKIYTGLLVLGIVREPLGDLEFKFERTPTH